MFSYCLPTSSAFNNMQYEDFDTQTKQLFYKNIRNGNLSWGGAERESVDLSYSFFRGTSFKNVSFTPTSCGMFFSCTFENCKLTNGMVLLGESSILSCDVENLLSARLSICPSSGSFTGWKKIFYNSATYSYQTAIVKLLIPADAERNNATGRKCRASHAVVEEIRSIKTGRLVKTGYSSHDQKFKYVTGSPAIPLSSFDSNRWDECSTGIHFFITREEALNYSI